MREAIRVWSRATGGVRDDDARGAVVVVPPEGDVQRGLRLATRLTTAQAPARLVMRGATSPDFMAGTRGANTPLIFTELDAYVPPDKGPALEALMPGFRQWLLTVFEGTVDGLDVSSVFWASAVTRLGLQDVFDGIVVAQSIAQAHAGQRIEVSEPGWVGGEVLAHRGLSALEGRQAVLLEAREGIGSPPSTPLGAIGGRLGASGGRLGASQKFVQRGRVAALAALAWRGKEMFRERGVRAFLRGLPPTGSPRVWLGVIGHWEFSSRHVVGSLGAYALETGTKVGVLLESSLSPEVRSGAQRATAEGQKKVLPVLSSKSLAGAWSNVEQLVSHQSRGAFLAGAGGTLKAMTAAVKRLASVGRFIDFGAVRYEVPLERGATLLVTLDVLRAREAAAATRAVVAKHDFCGAKVALSHASLVTDVVPDLILQQAGAQTLDIVHGALAETLDMVSTAKTFSSVKVLWTEAEADYLRPHLAPRCIGGAPARKWVLKKRPAPSSGTQVLVLSNYGTTVGRAAGTRLPRLVYQGHLLNDLAATLEKGTVLRWRPHPGDSEAQVLSELSRFEGAARIERSVGSLEEDLTWAHVIVSSLSSTIVEALAYDKPLLVHDIPVHEADVLMALFDPERRFRNVAELRVALTRAVAEVKSGALLSPEAALRVRFFGPSEVPRPVTDVVFSDPKAL